MQAFGHVISRQAVRVRSLGEHASDIDTPLLSDGIQVHAALLPILVLTMAPASPKGKRKAADAPVSPPAIKRKIQSATTSRLPRPSPRCPREYH